MKKYGNVATTNVIILATIIIVLIGALVCPIPILQQNANATPIIDPGDGSLPPPGGGIIWSNDRPPHDNGPSPMQKVSPSEPPINDTRRN